MDIDKLIDERQKTHGSFKAYADADQAIKAAIPPDFREVMPGYLTSGLDAIAGKMARIITGDPEEHDHWADIQGYAKAVQRCLPVSKKDTVKETVEETSEPAIGKLEGDIEGKVVTPARPVEHVKIQTYKQMSLEFVDPDQSRQDRKKIKLACDLTQKKVGFNYTMHEASKDLIQNLFNAEHTSIFEHCNLTLLARGISRSFLAQITRQGTFRFTSASQQYQDYRNYPMVLRPGWSSEKAIQQVYQKALDAGLKNYIRLIELGEKPEEARQVLPPAATVNLQITANARNIARFLRQRLCRRNVEEAVTFAQLLHSRCMLWLPELFELVHAPCVMDGKCNQGKLSCRRPYAA